jgi:exodeoxyribonuclease-3
VRRLEHRHIAEIDLKNWKSNQKNSGFLPEERAWLGALFDERAGSMSSAPAAGGTGEAYTWWSNRGQAWAKNVGWRIDYQIATPGLAARARRAEVYKAQRFLRPRAAEHRLRLCVRMTSYHCGMRQNR